MSSGILSALLHNAALLLALVVVYDIATCRHRIEGHRLRQAAVGIGLGALGIGLILASHKLEPGIVFDSRSVLLSVAGLFLGAIPTCIAMAMTAAFRLAQGGAAAGAGTAVILATGGIGIAWRELRRRPLATVTGKELYALGVVTHIVMLALMLLLPWETASRVLGAIGLPVMLIYPAATVALGLLLVNRLRREQTADELKENEQRYRGLFENNHAVMLVIEPDSGAILEANPAACRYYGWTRDVLTRMRIMDINTLSPEEIRAEIEQARTRNRYHFHFQHRLADGSLRDVEVFSGPIAFRGISALYSIVHDISERRQVEEERERLLADAQQSRQMLLNVIEDRQRAESEKANVEEQLLQAQKMESVGRLAGGVAHDFNNNLQVILGYSEQLQTTVDPAQPIHADLAEIHAAAQRSARLTSQLLAFARRQTILPRVLDLNEAVTGMLKMLRRLIGENIDLVWKPGSALWTLNVDPAQIDQILANLCVNARDAIGKTGTITLWTANANLDAGFCGAHGDMKPGRYVMLAVQDDGHGMDKDILARVFEPFFTTKDIGQGTGLGLSMIYGIVQQNRGAIDVDSEPGRGTTFRIYLPRHVESVEETPVKPAPAPIRGDGITILLVEDEAPVLDMIRAFLEADGFRVLAANSPNEAMKLVRKESDPIRYLITDVVMPGMNGRDLAGMLLATQPNLKCLFMSGYTADVISRQGVLDEGVFFIQKPFSRHDLTARIREMLADGG